ncbi:MAG: helix-turn-helix domain-containing protein [Culturomica sp.]|jgi:signal transduction histidine kinase/ligand-binding sensor domain-containing protein/DNA-binding response OmpR family regulator|nr:helix-turn-helix domain-containing protein [Culturomica sp.]
MKIILFLLFFCLFGIARAEENFSGRFDHFTQKEGLSNNQVHCIFQDSDGWMWFGTTYGINRFDGREFRTFTHDAADSTSLSANLVRIIFEDSRGFLWVGLENGGLCRFDRQREIFLRQPIGGDDRRSVNDIAEDAEGNLWLATHKGLVVLKQHKKGVFQAETIPLDLPSSLKKVAVDKHTNIWMGTEQGLYCYHARRNRLSSFPLPETERPGDEIWALYADHDDRIWIGTYNSGLYYINSWESRIIKSTFAPEQERAQTIRAIARANDGRLWIGTRAGLFSFDGKQHDYHGPEISGKEMSSRNSVLSLCVDEKGDLWVGSRQGISHFVHEKQFIRSYGIEGESGKSLNNAEIFAFCCDGEFLWIGTELGGVNRLNRKTGDFTYFTRQNSRLSSDCIKAFLMDGDELWLGTYLGGITVLDRRSGRALRTYSHHNGDTTSLADNRVWALFKDTENNIWIGSSQGVEQYNRTEKNFQFRSDILTSGQVNWITQDSEGDLWFGGENELILYTPSTRLVRKYFKKTRAMLEVPGEDFYVTTPDGLARFDKRRGFYRFYTEKEGLINNYTLGVLPGQDSTLWISTMNGLSVLDLTTGTFKNFHGKDGFQDNQYNYGAFAKNDRGELIFGGINGFDIIAPELVKTNAYIPPVVLTDFRVFNQKEPFRESPVRLSHNRNTLSFRFTALNYVMAEKNRYRYRLEGLEEKWVDAGYSTLVTYANLAPGTYTFRVVGSNNDGVWNKKGASLEIVIVPPFWQKWWFFVLVALAALLLTRQLVRMYTFRENMKNRLALEKAQARKLHEIDTLKLQFFTNVSHEIRTPLTLILGPIEKLWQEFRNEDIRIQLGIVRKNARKLLELINQLLDFRKLEAGKYSVEYQSGDLIRFLNGIAEGFRYPAAEKGIELTFESSATRFITAFDPDKLEKIIDNLLSNAIKFTEEGGKIRIKTEIGEQEYRIRVEDTGAGIPAENRPHIFNRFFQSAHSSEITGTGIGLSITKSFVELMEGSIEVESEPGKGSTFSVRLPVRTEAPAIAAPERDPEEKNRQNKYLLVVDDNGDIRSFIKNHFKTSFSVLEAANGREGFETAVACIPDIIIADMLMPEMNGREMCLKLRKDERTAHIPIVMLTAITSKEEELKSLLTGIDDYITKPFDIHILGTKIENLLQIRNSLREKIKSDLIMQPSEIAWDSPNEKFLKKAVDVVEKFMDDPELDIEKFSEEMGVSRMQLYRKFEAIANMTVKEFIRGIRLKRAVQLLKQGESTVSEIAWSVGFKDLSYFRKCFKEEFGMTPTEYAGNNES